MSNGPIIFISYAHADESDHPADGEVRWLSYVMSFLQPAVKHGIYTSSWVDRRMTGGDGVGARDRGKAARVPHFRVAGFPIFDGVQLYHRQGDCDRS